MCPKREGYTEEAEQQFSASAPPASLSLLGNFEVQQTNPNHVKYRRSRGSLVTDWKKIFAALFERKTNLAKTLISNV